MGKLLRVGGMGRYCPPVYTPLGYILKGGDAILQYIPPWGIFSRGGGTALMRGRVWSPSSLLTVGRGQWEAEGASGKRDCTRTASQRGKAVSSESDIRVPEAKRGRVPCRNEDDNRLSKRNYT